MRRTLQSIIVAILGLLLVVGCQKSDYTLTDTTDAAQLEQLANGQEADAATSSGENTQAVAPKLERLKPALLSMASQNVGLLGSYFQANWTSHLTTNGHTVINVNSAYISGGGLANLDALYILRDGAGVAGTHQAAIENFVSNGGILITEFDATVAVAQNFNLCSAGNLDVSFGIPSGSVCGGATINIVDPGSPIASGLPASFCAGDQIGVFKVLSGLDPNFNVVATLNSDQNGDGNNDPVVATCCHGAGVWVAFFVDFGDINFGAFTCGGFSCISAPEELQMALNAVELAIGGCDSDGDGCPDATDPHPNSIVTPTIVIDGCNTGVSNVFVTACSTMADLIADCAANAVNHGDFVSCVAHLTNAWKAAGLISGKQKGAIQSCAAKSNIP